MVMRNGPDGQALIPGRGKIFLFSTASRHDLVPTQPPIQWVTRVICLGVNRPGREANHSALSSVEVKNDGAIPPPSHIIMAQCLIN
jgi:hypothetical protein